MGTERHYTEEEVNAIFKQAAQAQETARRHLAQSPGLSLAELQEIGKEVGITPEFIARAAATVVNRADPPLPPRTFLGLPVGVAQTVDLPGPLTDEDWDKLVVDLRQTFRASGEVRREGSLREWRNGNLYALLEPTASGHRLHLGSFNRSLQMGLTGGMIGLAMGLMLMLMMIVSGQWMVVLDKTFIVSMFAVLGLGGMGVAGYRLPRWAEERQRQMEEVAGRAIERTETPKGAASAHTPLEAGRLDLNVPDDSADTVQARSRRSTRI